MHNQKQISHLDRIAARLETADVKNAFFLMLTALYSGSGYALRPASQGAFSVLQIRIDGENYFAFKGAKSHLRFYFRDPFFKTHDHQAVLNRFPTAEVVQEKEVAVNLHSYEDASVLLGYLKSLGLQVGTCRTDA
ncbi:hypothetical protein CLV80_102422 [Yoonia maritima]|uniref:Uncharacterized protein n=1 Tax=Yoonia maritima TaxID=1435347 RepID=A0A2T0W3I9_9RHOB|nr:hypothetical protein CLV80_102422 [Yoonia maritima]